MKTLILLRHAKSSWEQPGLADFDRPLNKRGRRDASRMGRFLRERNLVPDLVKSSSSVRTRETADLLFGAMEYQGPVEWIDALYHAEPQTIAEVISATSDEVARLMVIGHNPGFEDALPGLCGAAEEMPTAAAAIIDFDLESWSDVRLRRRDPIGKLRELHVPRELADEPARASKP